MVQGIQDLTNKLSLVPKVASPYIGPLSNLLDIDNKDETK